MKFIAMNREPFPILATVHELCERKIGFVAIVSDH